MGVSRSPEELARKLTAAGASISKVNPDAVAASANVYKAAVLSEARKDSGGDLRLSKWGKNGTKLNAGYELRGTGAQAQALLRPRPAGPWRVLEDGARPHIIVPGLTRRQARALTLFSVLAGKGGDLGGYDTGALAATARGNRNNRGGRRRKPLKPLSFGNGEAAAYAMHPGTKGKGTWSKGLRKGDKGAGVAYTRRQVEGWIKVFGR
jgi:hypothetical protein